jgi:hypothetical protein
MPPTIVGVSGDERATALPAVPALDELGAKDKTGKLP